MLAQLKDFINTMVDQLGQFAEVTRVSQEVGTEGYVLHSPDFAQTANYVFLTGKF